MNEHGGSGPGRATAAKTRETVARIAERMTDPAANVVAAPGRPHLVEASRRDYAELPGRIDDADSFTQRLKRGIASASRKVSPLLASFIACVLVPSFAAVLYFAFIAADQLAAEARFAVRQIEGDSGDSGKDIDSTGGKNGSGTSSSFSFTATGQNAYIVTSYIRSRAIVDDLSDKLNLREIFRRPEADFWARLKRNASIDELVEYWDSMVNTYIDGPSGIVTLRVRAFRADDAVALGKAVLDLSEALVNRISDRARRDAMEMSEKEVRRAYETTQAALADMRSFRDSAGIIDPVQAGTEIGKLLLPLLAEKIRMESELFVMSRDLDENAPTVRILKSKVESVEQQIAELKNRLTSTGGGERTLAASLTKFEELELQRQFAEKLYTLAQADLERARIRADRQAIYLTVFVPPSLPEESRYPRRLAFPILIFVGLSLCWAIVVMTLASIEDHRM